MRLERVSLWIAIAATIAVAALGYETTESLVAASLEVDRTHRAVEALNEVLIAVSAAGTARRAYLLGGEGAEVQRFDAAADEGRNALARSRELAPRDKAQTEKLDRVDALLRERLDSLEDSVDRRRRGLALDAPLPTRADTDLLTNLRTAVSEASAAERESLSLLEARAGQKAKLVKEMELFGTALSVALLLFAFGRIGAENSRRVGSESALRAARDAADAATQFLDSLVENLPAMVFLKDAANLRFERMNYAGEELLGVSRKDLIGKGDRDFFPESQWSFFEKKDRETLGRGVVVDIWEEPIETKAGRRWLHTRKVPLVDAAGVPRHLLGISVDITKRKAVEEELRAAREAAEAASRELEAFAYSVAHDLRAPLRSIDGFTRALIDDCGPVLPIVGRGHVDRVLAAAQRMGGLIDDMLQLSRVSRAVMRMEGVDLSAMAEQCVGELRQASGPRAVDVKIQPALTTRADPRLLRIVLDNLLGNAFKFTSRRERATIELGAREDGSERVYFVKDDGAGFDPRYTEKLFGAFQRLHNVREFPGTGIGLATVQRIVSRHGGRVWAAGEPDRGATFSFTLGELGAEPGSLERASML